MLINEKWYKYNSRAINPFFQYIFFCSFLSEKKEKIIVNQYSSNVSLSNKVKEDVQKQEVKNETQNKENTSDKAPFFYMRKNYILSLFSWYYSSKN